MVPMESLFALPPEAGGRGGDLVCYGCPARRSALCSALDDAEIHFLDAVATRVRVDRGQYLFMEEDPYDHVFNLSGGMLMLERLASDGRRQIMAFTYPGDFIGLGAGKSYSIAARALTPATACRWRMRDIERLYDSFPALERSVREIGNAVLAATMDQVFVLGRKNAMEKLAFFILHHMGRQERLFGKRATVALPMTRGDIADFLGATVETISRAFTRMRKENLIHLADAHEVEVVDRDRLAEVAEHFDT